MGIRSWLADFSKNKATDKRGRRVTATFKAQDVREDCVWFRLQEGEKKGLDFAIPISHERHSQGLQQVLRNVEEGRQYEVTFVADNARGTSHYCGHIEEVC